MGGSRDPWWHLWDREVGAKVQDRSQSFLQKKSSQISYLNAKWSTNTFAFTGELFIKRTFKSSLQDQTTENTIEWHFSILHTYKKWNSKVKRNMDTIMQYALQDINNKNRKQVLLTWGVVLEYYK